MQYKKFDNVYAMRLERGEEIIEQIKAFAKKENVALAHIEGIGATDDITIGIYDLAKKEYTKKNFKGLWEIVSLNGNITTMGDEPYLHLHICCSNEDGQIVAGHLNDAKIGVTGEIFITTLDGKIGRKKDESIGINLWDFKEY